MYLTNILACFFNQKNKIVDANAQIEWYKVDRNNSMIQLISKSRESIIITPIKASDLGRYRCKAVNSHGYRYRDAILTRNLENNIDIFIYGFVNEKENEPSSYFDYYNFNFYNAFKTTKSTNEQIYLNENHINYNTTSVLLNVKKIGKLRINSSIDLKCYSSKIYTYKDLVKVENLFKL